MNNVHVSKDSEIPIYRGLYKDHKQGRKYKGLVNGNVGPVSSLSEIISMILTPYMQELKAKVNPENTVKNTEELLALFEGYNQNLGDDCTECDNKFMASMDVESLYPSLKSEDTGNIIRETMINSDIEVENVDVRELVIFLRKNLSNSEIDQCAFKEYIPSRRKKIKGCRKSGQYDLWTFCENQPDKHVIKALLAEALALSMKLIINKHICKFAGEIGVQEDKGGI